MARVSSCQLSWLMARVSSCRRLLATVPSHRCAQRRAPVGHVHGPVARGPLHQIRVTRRGAHGGVVARRHPPCWQGGQDTGVAQHVDDTGTDTSAMVVEVLEARQRT